MPKNHLIEQLRVLEEEHKDLDGILMQVQEKKNCQFFTNSKA